MKKMHSFTNHFTYEKSVIEEMLILNDDVSLLDNVDLFYHKGGTIEDLVDITYHDCLILTVRDYEFSSYFRYK